MTLPSEGFTMSIDPPLQAQELELVRQARFGQCLNMVTSLDASEDGTISLSTMQSWGLERSVRAEVIRELLLRPAEYAVDAHGVHIRGARVTGPINLESTRLACPITLIECYLEDPDPINIDNACAIGLTLDSCYKQSGNPQSPSLSAYEARFAHDLNLSNSVFGGPVNVAGAHIDGSLILSGMRIIGTDNDGSALIGDGLYSGMGVRLDEHFSTRGAIRFPGACIAGRFVCSSAKILGSDLEGNSLICSGIRIDRGIFLDAGFTARGAVRLSGAELGGRLSLKNAKISGVDQEGYALTADRIKVGARMYLDEGFSARGAIRMSGATITGRMIFNGATISNSDNNGNAIIGEGISVGGDATFSDKFSANGALRLQGSSIGGILSFSGAEITAVDRRGNSLHLDGITAKRGLYLDDKFKAVGAVRLPGATIFGELHFCDAEITGADTDRDAFVGDGLVVNGNVNFDQSSVTVGAVRLPGANIQGELAIRNSELNGMDMMGYSLLAKGMKIGEDAFLDLGLTIGGAVFISGSSITGTLSFCGATIRGRDKEGDAITGDEMHIGQGMFFNDSNLTDGAVVIARSHVAAILSFAGANISGINAEGSSLVADGVQVGSDFVGLRLATAGSILLRNSHIQGDLKLVGTTLGGIPTSLDASGARIGQVLIWKPSEQVKGTVDLQRASANRLDDYWEDGPRAKGNWPPKGKLNLSGFVYNGLGGEGQPSATERIREWIRRNHKTEPRRFPVASILSKRPAVDTAGFSTQPYQQLAFVYRQSGQDTEAREVAIARENDLRSYGSLTRMRMLRNWVLDKTIKHGYQPLRAVAALVSLYFIASIIFWLAQYHTTVMIPAKDTRTIRPAPTATTCSSKYPCFYALGYAFDTTIPIVRLGQGDNWRIDGSAPWGKAYIVAGSFITMLGWALTTLAVVGYTGLVRRD